MSARATTVAPGIERGDTARFPQCRPFHNFQNLSPAGRSSTTCRSRSIGAIGLNHSPDPLTVRSAVFTFLPYGSDNYFSSDKKTGWLDRTNRGADRRVSREVDPR